MAATPGRALRVYQIVAILALGWVAGRLPDLFRDRSAEEGALRAALGPAASAQPTLAEERVAAIAAEVAARVAAAAADETVARLVAAGWGPAGHAGPQPATPSPTSPPTVIVREGAPPRLPAEIRVVHEQRGWSLPPGPPGPPGAAAPGAPAAPPQAAAGLPARSAPPAGSPAAAEAYRLAEAGYAALRAGDRREAAALLGRALATAPAAEGAAAWAADLRQLTRRWQVEAWVLAREAVALSGDPLAASPVLGAAQTGASLALTPDPLARVRISAVARIAAAAGASGGFDSDTAEGAIGIRVQPARLPVAADVERRFALGPLARSTWAARVMGGERLETRVGRRPVTVDGWAEGGIVGFARPDIYAGAQLRAGTPLWTIGRNAIDIGAGSWGAMQESGGIAANRLDVGPSMRLQLKPWPFMAQVDYRWRAAGNAEPGSGPVLTVSGSF